MKFYLTLSFILTLSNLTFSQKWTEWKSDTTYSITGKKRIHSIRKKVNSKPTRYQETWLYFNQCNNLELKTKSIFEEQFVPKYLKSNSKKHKTNCNIKIDSLFPNIINKEIEVIANYNDSTITVNNNSDTTITACFNNEWDFEKKGIPLGELPPKSKKTFRIPKYIYNESQFQLFFFEAYQGQKLIKRG